jgi:hypothetical protein
MDNAGNFISKYFSWVCFFFGGHQWSLGAPGFKFCIRCGRVNKHDIVEGNSSE